MRMKPYFYKVIKAYQSFSTAFIWSFLFLTFTSINSEEEKKIPFVQQIRILTFREWSCRGCTFMATHQPFLFMNSLLSSLFLWLSSLKWAGQHHLHKCTWQLNTQEAGQLITVQSASDSSLCTIGEILVRNWLVHTSAPTQTSTVPGMRNGRCRESVSD